MAEMINVIQLPTTNVWDPSVLQDIDVKSPQFKELLVKLFQNINDIALVLNIAEYGYYDTITSTSGKKFYPNPSFNSLTPTQASFRDGLHKVVIIGQLPNTTSKTVAHNIPCTPNTTFTAIYGTANDTAGFNYIPLPYASASGTDNIEVKLDATNITITTASDRTNFNNCQIILEYLQT